MCKDIIDHRKNARAIPLSEGYDIGPNGQENTKKKIVGWDICVEFVDGSI